MEGLLACITTDDMEYDTPNLTQCKHYESKILSLATRITPSSSKRQRLVDAYNKVIRPTEYHDLVMGNPDESNLDSFLRLVSSLIIRDYNID